MGQHEHFGSVRQSDVDGLTTDLAAKAPAARTISTTAPLTGGGDLSANRTLGITVGTVADTVAAGDHNHNNTYVDFVSAQNIGGVKTFTTTGSPVVPAPTVAGNPVRWDQRGPIGGVSTVTYAATITPDATVAVHFRIVATGALAINVPTGGVDGQKILFEIQASGAQRVVTFASGYELGEAVTSRTVTIASGLWGYIGVTNRAGTYRLLAVDDGTA